MKILWELVADTLAATLSKTCYSKRATHCGTRRGTYRPTNSMTISHISSTVVQNYLPMWVTYLSK